MQESFLKIISATYKLLEFFPDGDPLKNRAKEKVLMIMEKLATGAVDAQVVDDITILENYLELAKGQGWVQDINFLIVSKEYAAIKNIARSDRAIKLKNDERFEDNTRPKQTTDKNYSDRQNVILKILNRKEKIQVQDIIKEMPDVTKRTIRRDLDDLLKKGKIARIGEFNQVFYQKPDRTRLLS